MLENRKLHLVQPSTGARKWYLPTSPMAFFFSPLLFPLITRQLWGWLAVWIGYDLAAIVLTIVEDDMAATDARAVNKMLQFIVLGLSVWTAFVVNKQATRKLLAQNWLISSDTTEPAWQLFHKKWNLPDTARQVSSPSPPVVAPQITPPVLTST